MNPALPKLIDAFTGLRVAVIGEAMLDVYLQGSSGRLCREAPVPIVSVTARKDAPGGAANTAVNVAALGGCVSFLSVIGDDLEGAILRQTLEGRGVSPEHVLTQPSRCTLVKHRVSAASHLLLRFDHGHTDPVDRKAEQDLIDHLQGMYAECDAIIVSDYSYGVLTPRVIQALAHLQAQSPRLLVIDAKNLAAYRQVGVTAVKPNYSEAMRLLGCSELDGSGARVQQVATYAECLLDLTGAHMAAITLDTEGALIVERGSPPYRTYARPTQHSRAAGAGDTFVSALALALAAGALTPAAAELASAAAAVVVAKEGTSTCSVRELRAWVTGEEKFVSDIESLTARVECYRKQDLRIVFTTGCFDILHRGHITYLNRAKLLGDILIVGLNSDASVCRLKGSARPINALEDRAQVLAALSCVDHVVPFEEDTPTALIRAVRPDVFVKGGDYTRETLPEAPLVEQLGGRVEILPYMQDRSTTGIIERLRQVWPATVKVEREHEVL